MNALRSQGCANIDDAVAFSELTLCHPEHDLPKWSTEIPPALSVDSQSVLDASEAYPRGIGPGFNNYEPR